MLRHPHKIRIGDNVVIDDNCLLDAKGDRNSGITIASGVFVGRNSILSCKGGDITLDEGVNIGFNCEVFSASHVRIGARTLLAAYCYVIGGDHEYARSGAADSRAAAIIERRRHRRRGVARGRREGARWRRIGDGAIVGAGAVVRGDIPAKAIAVGMPARVVGSRETAVPGAEAHESGRRPSGPSTCCRSAITSAGTARACTA